MSESEKSTAPIALFVYARPQHTKATVEALAANEMADRSELFVFSDAPRSEKDADAVAEVREYIRGIKGFAAVHVNERSRNFGLADSIVDGVGDLVSRFGNVIVLEDDVLTSPYFLRYMNDALERYRDEERVMQIDAHMFPVLPEGLPDSFFLRISFSWGWATWERAWRHFHRRGREYIDSFTPDDINKFNLDGAFDHWSHLLKNEEGSMKTWAVYWYACIFSRGGLCLYPRRSLAQNIGLDGSGENCGVAQSDLPVLGVKAPAFYPDVFEEHGEAMRRYQRQLRDWGMEARRLNKMREGYSVAWSFLPLDAGISLFSRKESRLGARKVKWCVLGIPVLKRERMPSGRNKYLLMGFIPLPL